MSDANGHFVALEGVTKRFDELLVLDGIDLTVDLHQVVCMIGASGSGKSTLLRCINLLETVDEGTILFDGQTITNGQTDVNALRRKIGIVFQAFNLFPHMTVMQNITLAPLKARGLSRAEARTAARDLLHRIGLLDKADEYPDRLSGGQQQRVAIARALATRPEVIFCDEPTGALDTRSAADVLQLLRDAVDQVGATVVMVTHDPVAASYADRVVFLADGAIAADIAAPGAPAIADRLTRLGERAEFGTAAVPPW
jgi:polar amino acid transport system ATP-binding protein